MLIEQVVLQSPFTLSVNCAYVLNELWACLLDIGSLQHGLIQLWQWRTFVATRQMNFKTVRARGFFSWQEVQANATFLRLNERVLVGATKYQEA
jgi:hypothetical protein